MKTTHKTTGVGWVTLLLLLVPVTLVMARPATQGGYQNPSDPRPPSALSPGVHTLDQITHNKGNIVTTIDNFGYIGGYQYYGYPSGEWPRNSGHDYIGEIRYWMGAVTPGGDTLVANTYDDFEATPMPVNGEDEYLIYLSTDTSRYWNYDPTDTVGLGGGSPAFGWRVWDPSGDVFDFNEIWDPLAATYDPGGPTSLQESHYRFNDAAEGAPLLGLELTQTIMQWNYCYNEDFLFVVLEITNTSVVDYSEFAFGLYIDIDVGGPDGTGENGRLNDMVAYDVDDNLAWNYDVAGYDPGWKTKTGVMGTKILEMPDGLGMTAFRSDDWAIVTGIDDPGMFELINSTQFDESLPPTDQFYIQCTRGIDLTAGKTVRCVFALVAGKDEADFRNNASLAQNLYDNNFIGPQPPATPTLTARASEGQVYLNWDDTAEVSIDPLSSEVDFVGYKLYRSNNQGRSWGAVDDENDNSCLDIDYDRIAEFSVSYPGDPINHSYIDTGLYNGVEYWYCLVAYDRGDLETGVDVLQSGFGIAGEVSNVVAATPTAAPAGFYDAASSVKHTYDGAGSPSQGNVVPIVFDTDDITGSEYQVVFEDTPDNEATVWHLINVTSGDTLLFDQETMSGDEGLYEVVEGLRVVVTDVDREPASFGQTGFSGADTSFNVFEILGPPVAWLYDDPSYVWGNEPYRNTYELRYTGDSTRATWLLDWYYGQDIPYWVPFEVWNTTSGERVSISVLDWGGTGVWDASQLMTIVDWPYNAASSVTDSAFPNHYSWLFDLDVDTYDPATGDVVTMEGAPMNGPADVFTFKPDGISASAASNELKNIRVVPNPYFGRFSGYVETASEASEITFNRIPVGCTIRIYTLAGDLVATLHHTDGDGSESWNLQSDNGRQVASGMYVYHVESEYGEHLGRFAIIK
ncbi:MAG: hypothetical protein OEV49_07190 [candidate division Zixibacteria bacterium]|nr:hypothetical protein [candidate division Zixibacteria bacterium]MDH3937098.1 hypothetical protein [candidate division Zixibacteria bacterium]MDH4033056.1 hypothetical protein [candidate division Zixibacteria bacterium]